jgi:single-strand DNA-binding protein
MTALLTIHRERVHAPRTHLSPSHHVVMRRFRGAPGNSRYPAFDLEPKEDCNTYQSLNRLHLIPTTMKSLNKVIVIGHLATDPFQTQTKTGEPCVNLCVAIHRDALSDGAKRETTDYHRVVVLGRLGEICAKYLSKGQGVFVAGALVNCAYEKGGERRYMTEIHADEVNMLTWKKRSGVKSPCLEVFLPRETAGTQTPKQRIHSSDGKDM